MPAPVFDLELWKRRLERFHEQFDILCDSPISIVAIEHYRALAAEHAGDLGRGVPVDRFVLGKGEAPERHLTKVNGLPYRPADQPWPRDRDGSQMVFLAQFCFVDSRDLFPALPGDVLLIFLPVYWGPEPGASPTLSDIIGLGPRILPEDPVFEWYRLGLTDLVSQASIPKSPQVFPTCFGVRYRTFDHADEAGAMKAMEDVFPARLLPTHEFFREAMLRALCCHPRIKVGGLPFQYERATIEGRFLGSFWGVCVAGETPYPWTNQRQWKGTDDENFLEFRQGCSINIYLKSDSTAEWDICFL